MTLRLLALAALVLAIERIAYVLVCRFPTRFRELAERFGSAGSPINALKTLFIVFKILQIGVFALWIGAHSQGRMPLDDVASPVLAAGVTCIVVGQALNLSVFAHLGSTGVFYGNRLGYRIHQSREFPFSALRHPQYVGTVMSIWGLFLITRFPQPDWYFLPALETAYYSIGARFER